MGCDIPFFVKPLKDPIEGYNRACKGYKGFMGGFGIRDFDIA